jgi:hypothetical protein
MASNTSKKDTGKQMAQEEKEGIEKKEGQRGRKASKMPHIGNESRIEESRNRCMMLDLQWDSCWQQK